MNRHTKTYDIYEVVKVPFPFTDIQAQKIRPALILSSAKYFNAKIGASVMAMITSIKPDRDLWPSDIIIEHLKIAGLPAPSIVRLKLFTLDHRLILGRIGNLAESDRNTVQKKLREILTI